MLGLKGWAMDRRAEGGASLCPACRLGSRLVRAVLSGAMRRAVEVERYSGERFHQRRSPALGWSELLEGGTVE